jgi:hypothetical protein
MKLKYELKKINGYLLAISKEEMRIGDYAYNPKTEVVYVLNSQANEWDEKVVMHLPLDGNKPYSGLHLMPNLDINVYIDCLYNYITFNAVIKGLSYYSDTKGREKFKNGFASALELYKDFVDNIYNNYPLPSEFEVKIDVMPIKINEGEVIFQEGFITDKNGLHNEVVGEYIYNFD